MHRHVKQTAWMKTSISSMRGHTPACGAIITGMMCGHIPSYPGIQRQMRHARAITGMRTMPLADLGMRGYAPACTGIHRHKAFGKGIFSRNDAGGCPVVLILLRDMNTPVSYETRKLLACPSSSFLRSNCKQCLPQLAWGMRC
jgi:hypothetical protein